MEEIILKYLANRMTIDDQHRLTKWLEEDRSNAEILNKIEAYWEHDPSNTESIRKELWNNRLSPAFDEKFKQEPFKKNQLISSRPKGLSRHLRWLSVAAMILIACSLTLLVSKFSDFNNLATVEEVRLLEKVSLNGQKINIQLPDGSHVKLNSGSRLIAPDKFVGDVREVELYGEAYFEVVRDEDHPFIVKTNGINVEVLGTSFNVRSYLGEEVVKVAVNSGSVAVSESETGNSLILYPTEMAVYDREDQTTTKTNYNPKEILSWKDKVLYFQEANIDEVILSLERWYGVEIELRKKIDKRKDFTAEYPDKSLEVVLDGLSYVFDFEYNITDNKVTIK